MLYSDAVEEVYPLQDLIKSLISGDVRQRRFNTDKVCFCDKP